MTYQGNNRDISKNKRKTKQNNNKNSHSLKPNPKTNPKPWKCLENHLSGRFCVICCSLGLDIFTVVLTKLSNFTPDHKEVKT